MMHPVSLIFYNLGILIYVSVLRLISPFHPKANKWITGRKNTFNKIKEWKNNTHPSFTILIHCASLGEYEQSIPLLSQLKTHYPNGHLVITFFSPSGYDQIKINSCISQVFYLPADFRRDVKRFVKCINPKMVILIHKELWYHFINELYLNKIPIYIVNGVFNQSDISYYPWNTHALKRIRWFFLVDSHSTYPLVNKGFNNIKITGDLRIERMKRLSKEQWNHPLMEFKQKGDRCFIYGSVYSQDIHIIQPFIQDHPNDIHLIFPHELDQRNIAGIKKKLILPCEIYSEHSDIQTNIYIIDIIGVLKYAYRMADVVYIGGGFNQGIHSVVEALVYSKPVIFGPNYHKYPLVKELLKYGYACSIRDSDSFAYYMNIKWAEKDKLRTKIEKFVDSKSASSEEIVQKIQNLNESSLQ
ncbi:MAG TPA: glycosyltransferase N-terminal domain-containing protein [Saprospiraceae bacterium]|nr:glycosyltransferase N-terminal domain-containing protein [Saprospiraceae bacterium]